MFQEQIDHAIALFTRLSIGERPSIMFKDIEQCPMPASLRKFYSLEADTWMADEKKRLLDAQHFSYTDPVILQHLEGIVRSAKGNACFQREEFLSILRNAVTLLFNYTCRPQYTLSSYLFADAENLGIDGVLERMSHFTDYDYFHTVLVEYAGLKHLQDLHRARFEELLAMIDHEVVRHLDSRSLAHLTAPMFTLFQPGEEPDFARIPLDALAIFFDDKDLTTVVERIETEKQAATNVTMHELVMLIGDVDFSTGLDIRSIVSRQFGVEAAPPPPGSGSPASSGAAPERPGAMDLDSTLERSGVEQDIEVNLDALDVSLTDEGRPGALASAFGDEHVRTIVTGTAGELPPEDIDEPIGGEHLTPSFGVDDALDTRIAPSPLEGSDDVTIPPVFIGDAAAGTEVLDVASSLEVTIVDDAHHDDDVSVPGVTFPAYAETDAETDAGMDAGTDAGTVGQPGPAQGNAPYNGLPYSDAQSLDTTLTASDDEQEESMRRGMHDSAMGDGAAASTTAQDSSTPSAPVEDAALFTAPVTDAMDSPGLRSMDGPAPDLADLRSLIPHKEQKRYIKKLFQRNEAAFNKALETLNAKNSWPEASPCIDELFLEHRVDQYSRIAVEFADLIFSRFNPKK